MYVNTIWKKPFMTPQFGAAVLQLNLTTVTLLELAGNRSEEAHQSHHKNGPFSAH